MPHGYKHNRSAIFKTTNIFNSPCHEPRSCFMLYICVDVANTALVPVATETCARFKSTLPRQIVQSLPHINRTVWNCIPAEGDHHGAHRRKCNGTHWQDPAGSIEQSGSRAARNRSGQAGESEPSLEREGPHWLRDDRRCREAGQDYSRK